MRLHIAGVLQLPYIKAHQKRINKLVNNKTTIAHDLGVWKKEFGAPSLKGSYLDAVYSIPVGIAEPKISDICMVHLIDQSGLVIAEKKNVKYTNLDDLCDMIEDMVFSLKPKGWVVVIESNHNGVVQKNTTEVIATHAMEAITNSIMTLASNVYEDLPSDNYKNTVIDGMTNDLMNLRNIFITLDNGSTYKLIAVAPALRPVKEFKNSVQKIAS